jgi:tetratricopeptide (TPR) repeat protein
MTLKNTQQGAGNETRGWYEKVTIPTYEVGQPEKNPMFLEKRVYQGSSGAVYPYPVVEKITDKKTEREYQAVMLENKYLKIMILPEIGGRIQMAYDKMKRRHFIYYNQVIKPALVGLTGPWISGGIEFNWPQHHRPTTFDPVDHSIEENPDGSVTVWCSETERMFRTKGMAGFTLYPDKAYLEIKVRLYNRTEVPQTFLWWANPAVKVNDHYHSVFPPDVHAVFDHGKRDTSTFPIATGTYYKVDYSPGTDISRYKNIPVPTSYMAITSKYDFVGGYEGDSRGGLLHVANHHVSPGKKQWTWGNGDFGRAWDRHLTDEDGPYIELMCGVYTDNQPDFSWLMPGEEKAFSQFFMPYRDLGMVKNATKDAMVNLEITGGHISIRAFTTAEYPDARVVLTKDGKELFGDAFDFHPGTSYEKKLEVPERLDPEGLTIRILSNDGRCLVSWTMETEEERPPAEAARPIAPPGEIGTNEALYQAGLHLEQYRHATYDPRDYYLEALKRDPGDIRCNNSMGLWYLRRGQFAEAERHFRTAQDTLTKHNPNPLDGEPAYNLGVALLLQGRDDEAYDTFYKSVWNAAQVPAGYFQIARIDTARGSLEQAMESIDWSLAHNARNHKARHLKVVLLRKLGDTLQALETIRKSLELDRFNFPLYLEWELLTPGSGALQRMENLMRGNIHNYLEHAWDYARAGCYPEALQMIDLGIQVQKPGRVYPLALYVKAWLEDRLDKMNESRESLLRASEACPDYCFPNQPEAVVVLEWAIRTNPADARARYYLGNLLYNARIYDKAIHCWEESASLNDAYPTVLRNLSLAYFNKKRDRVKALQTLRKAFSLGENDPRILMELDQLCKRLNHPATQRLDLLEKHTGLVLERDDLYLERACLYNQLGLHEQALELMRSRKFHPWEGGEGKVIAQHTWSLLAMASKAMRAGRHETALALVREASNCPENLGEEKLFREEDSEINYWLGLAHKGVGENGLAASYFRKAGRGPAGPSMAMFYNDQPPDAIYYQGLALRQLGDEEGAAERFRKLVDYGEAHMDDAIRIDYFAVSLPDLLIWEEDLNQRNKQLCHYLIALGKSGLGEHAEAGSHFSEVLSINNTHEGTVRHLQMRASDESKLAATI